MKKHLLRFLLAAFMLGASLVYWFYPVPQYPYNLAVCAMFKNEAPWLNEWIAYHHHILGFERFYLYNNDSTDDYLAVLQPYIDKGIVELIDWSSADESHHIRGVSDIDWYPCQIGAYNECLKKRALGKAKWVAVIDIDEFIVPVHGVKSFHANLRSAERRRKGSIKFSWRTFGTSDVWELEEGELLTEKLTQRAPDSYVGNLTGKCMHRPEAVEFCHIHDAPRLNKGYRKRHAKPEEIRVNHYWSRTGKYCEKKRGLKREKNKEYFEVINAIEDQSITQYIPALKKALTYQDK